LVLLAVTEESTVTVKLALVLPAATVAVGGLNEKPLAGVGVIRIVPPNPVARLTLTSRLALPPAKVLAEPAESVKPGTSATATDADWLKASTVPVKVSAPGPLALTV
jgi:hypothetical protein